MLPEWVIALIKVIAITGSVILALIYSVQGGQSRANHYFSWSKQFDWFAVRAFYIILPIQSAIVLTLGMELLPSWLYLSFLGLFIIMVFLMTRSYTKKVSILKLSTSFGSQLLIAFTFVLFVMGAGFGSFIIAMLL